MQDFNYFRPTLVTQINIDGITTTTAQIVTDYYLHDVSPLHLTYLAVNSVAIPLSDFIAASGTVSTTDDALVMATAMAGADTVYGSDYADVLDGFNGNDAIFGNGSNDTVYGEAGNDYLDGGVGADTMVGGLGNDAYIVDQAADQVIEAAGQGTDALYTSVSYALAAGQQIETIATTSQTGIGAINLYGNEFSQTINGNNGANVISGGGGNDIISGFSGNDTLTGGAGNDVLIGGAGRDALVGGGNLDRFDFNAVTESRPGAASATSSPISTARNTIGSTSRPSTPIRELGMREIRRSSSSAPIPSRTTTRRTLPSSGWSGLPAETCRRT